ncbi:MAG: N-formylglutamate deformylase, partial [uncultured Ramlibacter sp.]
MVPDPQSLGTSAEDPVLRAVPGRTALVFDSPHSGTQYPADFDHVCELAVLRRAEDTHVER